ncbi:MAG: NAD+ synthase [Bacteroidales bacterium]|nr:NAD+ synthase [Bacteroidales bacterium]
MKIALAQLNFHIGNFDSNKEKILEAIRKAEALKADLVVFSELAITGYPPRDFLEFEDFVAKAKNAVDEIAISCKNIAAIIGMPTPNTSKKGKLLFNSAAFLEDGKVKKIIHKTLLPNYDIFDEYRYFEPNREFEIIGFRGKKIALTICEDIWDVERNRLYTVNPMEELIVHKPDIMINIAASPFNYNQAKIREEVLRRNTLKYNLPLFYVNHVGAQTELLFDGGSVVMAPSGKVVDVLNYFEEDLRVYELEETIRPKKFVKQEIPSKSALIHDALVMGIRNYFNKLGFKKAILGLSGGIDSAVTTVLAAEALGKENVYNVLLPSKFSSDHSISDSLELVKNLQMPHDIIPIENSFETLNTTLEPYFHEKPFDITEENLQARIRGVILMALSNKFGYILLNTSNKSEAAVGYGTLYGDMNGGLSVLGDVYKTEVYELARYINRNGEIIPENIILKAPSAELRPGQKDQDSLPDYAILDKILYQYIELRKGPSEIIAMGFEEELVKKVLRLVNINEYKRYQTPPILRVSGKAFGMGRRMPIVAKYLS